ncbi:aspartate-semialdehyde dehydrogenase [Streptomyces sp. NPDC101160]|uniref:aspartate-semialdehyde dehydrogenase n=1 Tax=Streptomyces sp. NPDC101160 TaxID=3366118 RepID=UPI003801055F
MSDIERTVPPLLDRSLRPDRSSDDAPPSRTNRIQQIGDAMTAVDDPTAPRIAVVGATGAVGGTLLELVEDHRLRYRALHLIASARSAGREIRVDGRDHPVHDVAGFDFSRADVAFFFAGADVSRRWAPLAAAAGALVVDGSRAFRLAEDVPLVVPGVNDALLRRRPARGLVAGPGAATVALVRVLAPIVRRWAVRRVVVSTYQPASEAGHSGIEELQEGTRARLQDPQTALPAETFSPPLAFDVLTGDGGADGDGDGEGDGDGDGEGAGEFTAQERGLRDETRRVLGLPELDLTATCVRVPVVNGQCAAVWVDCAAAVDRTELIALLRSAPGVTVHDGAAGATPTPATLGDPDRVHVGRIRVSPADPTGFWLWLVADNLRGGAALNAVQVLGGLTAHGTL